jgi:hypothetical protein
MAIALDPKQIVSSEELLMSQVVQQEALTMGGKNKPNLKIELVDFEGTRKRVKEIKQRKKGMYKRLKRGES